MERVGFCREIIRGIFRLWDRRKKISGPRDFFDPPPDPAAARGSRVSADIPSLRLQFIEHEAEMPHERNACLNHVKRDCGRIDPGDRSGNDHRGVGQQRDAEREP
jgi:hypothetical protein